MHADLSLDRAVANELGLQGTHGIPAHRCSVLLQNGAGSISGPGDACPGHPCPKEAGEAPAQLETFQKPGIQIADTFP